MFDLSGRAALVTGASGGIGGAIARALHAQGGTVALTGRNAESLEALAGELGGRAHVLVADLSDSAAVDALMGQAEEAMGKVDVLINNAGLTRDTLAMRMKDEDWDEVIAVNLTAGFRLARASLRGMMRARFGRIVNITSVVGHVGNPGQANYVASKAGLSGMTKALAAEVAARGITVNCVSPGFISTAMTDALGDDLKEGLMSRIPAGRFGEPEDVAGCVAFLASDEAGYVTGQTLHVNGGMAMI